MRYVDASALLRLLFREPGLVVPLAAGERLVSSRLVEVETARAVDRARLLGHLDDRTVARKRAELAEVLKRIDLVAIGDLVIARARDPFAVNVRALDAIHVAAAVDLSPLDAFVTYDERQAAAARLTGLRSFSPGA